MLRQATDADLDMMLAWRNQDANRAVSNYQHEITPDEHAAWWAKTKADPTRRVLMFCHNDRTLGVVTFFDLELDVPEPTGSWGFYLDNETITSEGIGMLAWIKVMEDATAYAFDDLGLEVLNAEVNEENRAVRLMNRRFRFVEGQPQTVEDGRVFLPITLRRADRRTSKRGQDQ